MESSLKDPSEKPQRPTAAAQIFGHFTRRDFWIELLEGIVKASVTAFFIALGETLIKHGRKRGGADATIFDSVSTPPTTPAAQAFSRGYNPSSYSNNPPSQPPSFSGEWPGFKV